MDFSRLREQTIGSDVDEEAVTVNTRALIDKVLARYSGDWTTLRELIQNAADASASKVKIKFETFPSKNVPTPSQGSTKSTWLSHIISHHTLQRLTVSNNGQPFGKNDWDRLRRIAEGNPDETKIGAFGVGFYSVFADCEEPFVVSGSKTMAFLWRGNSLYTKSSTIPADQLSQDTTFVLNYRNTTTPLPALLSVCQFLTTSLTFVGLQDIELWIDDWKILSLQKKSAPGIQAPIPPGLKTTTNEGLMKITGLTNQATQIDATWLNIVGKPNPQISSQTTEEAEDVPVLILKSFFSRVTKSLTHNSAANKAAREAEAAKDRELSDNLHLESKATVFLRISTVNIQTSVSKTFAAELERATKKPPPKTTRIAILTASKDETSASLTSSSGLTMNKAEEIFDSVLPNKHGRIFIGFPTAQTTGLLCHISAPSIIPTVERENIDLNARYVKTWNAEMLRVAGIACRIAYSEAFSDMKKDLLAALKTAHRTVPKMDDIAPFIPHASHIFSQYTSKESTPSSLVGSIIHQAFWDSSQASMDVLSTKGVLASNQVRLVAEPPTFLENIPIIPSDLAKGSEEFIRVLYDRRMITDMTVVDVRKELEAQSLTEEQLIEFLKYLALQASTNAMEITIVQSLLNAAVGAVAEGSDKGKLIALSEIKNFVSKGRIPPDMPTPPSTIPHHLTKDIKVKDLERFNWEELQILPWVQWLLIAPNTYELTAEQDMTKSPQFANSVLSLVSRLWDQMSQPHKATLIQCLANKSIMPTKMGMRVPSEAYFDSVKLFDDLPIVSTTKVKDAVLTALGVRKTIELKLVFERLLHNNADGENKWSIKDLIQYLVTVETEIPKKDIELLKTTAIAKVEINHSQENNRPAGLVPLHRLYAPLDANRNLGLPVLLWQGHFAPMSREGRFMKQLGLKTHPQASDVIDIMVAAAKSKDEPLYNRALNYFIENYETNGYRLIDKRAFNNRPFLLTEGKQFPHLYSPAACFSNEQVAILGYPVLLCSYRGNAFMFGVESDPPMASCANTVIANPPITKKQATDTFSYLSTRVGSIDKSLTKILGDANIVPIHGETGHGAVRMTCPNHCYIGDSSTYADILDFVDFGQAGNAFLLQVGSKHEPTTNELARRLKDEASRFLNTLGETKYEELLFRLAQSVNTLRIDKDLWKALRGTPFLLAYRESVPNTKSKDSRATVSGKEDFEAEEKIHREVSLRRPSEIVIPDAHQESRLFRDKIFTSPVDDTLEAFYSALGAPLLSSLLDNDERIGTIKRDQSEAEAVRNLLVERSQLFLHEYTSEILHNAKWLEKNLEVVLTESLSLTITLRGHRGASHQEKKTAILSSKHRGQKLFITHQPDLYEVSRCIAPLLLRRQKHHEVLALETVLASNLKRLRQKGYNVDRILRKQAYETRIAEEEHRKRQTAQAEDEAARKNTEKQRVKDLAPPPSAPSGDAPPGYTESAEPLEPDTPVSKMPGGFEADSPPQSAKRGKNVFSQITDWSKKLKKKPSDESWSDAQTGQLNAPATGPSANTPAVATGQHGTHTGTGPVDAASGEKNITTNIDAALNNVRPFNSNALYSPGQVRAVEQATSGTYCDTTSQQDLTAGGRTNNGIAVFVHRTIAGQQLDWPSINLFSKLLLEVANVFKLPTTGLNIFHAPNSNSIAFNASGSLFFNHHFFLTLHRSTIEESRTVKVDAMAYWWTTMCHELAHNIMQEHNVAHGFYTESFMSRTFASMMAAAERTE
ncbi:hypothetical protein BT63DRAFT_375697 [Microthyrium microscopicum]|uniref:Sacsin/Nov domain-containing protein n=1 Tax=Microthyrium microscopicum TaxID=703497 RepID=A0A6A6U4L6_9PEZI|nr:hypothetical protein BT63DRAFT_375697 [Microthyrium microscopicum]